MSFLLYLHRMRTTIRMNDELLRRAKKLATDTDRSLTRVIEDALRETLQRSSGDLRPRSVRLTTFGSGGARKGVDLDSGRRLRDLMDLDETTLPRPDDPD